jgi:hypothetical protein
MNAVAAMAADFMCLSTCLFLRPVCCIIQQISVRRDVAISSCSFKKLAKQRVARRQATFTVAASHQLPHFPPR